MNPPPLKHKLFFWLLLASYSVFFAEVFSGADLFPFYHFWGLVIVLPLYGLHALLLLTLIYRYGRPRLSTLVFAGMLFGLYEAYITKVLWDPTWGAIVRLGDVAVLEVLVLVLWWHTWLSFITPALLAEGLLTRSREVLSGLPPRLRRLYGSWKGWLLIAAFGAVVQSSNSEAVLLSALSGLGTIGWLGLLTWAWRRWVGAQRYALEDLLPGPRAFALLALWLGGIYLFNGFTALPERLPPVWPGQVLIWALYAVTIALFVRALRRSRAVEGPTEPPAFPTAKVFLLLGLGWMVALPLVRWALGGVSLFILMGSWALGIALGIWGFVRAWKETRAAAPPVA